MKVSRRSNRVEVVQKKKDGTVVSRRKEHARVVCKRRSPEGQNPAERGRVLRKGERRSSLKGQKSAESRVLRGVGGRLKKSKKNPARAGWPRRLALVRATSRAEVDVIGAQLCSCARAIFLS